MKLDKQKPLNDDHNRPIDFNKAKYENISLTEWI